MMGTERLEAFSDGVLAIIITIMVLELKVPHDASLAALRALIPVFGSYVLSFVYVGIYWNNHHHMLHVTKRVDGSILWANLHLLFWLSLLPFATGWMGENTFARWPTVAPVLPCRNHGGRAVESGRRHDLLRGGGADLAGAGPAHRAIGQRMTDQSRPKCER